MSAPVATPRETPDSGAAPDFASLYAEFFPFVWRCLRGLGIRDALLEDTAQDVFVIVHRRLPEFAGRSSVRTWLYGIVRNVASNRRRGSARRPDTHPLVDDIPSSGPSPLEHVEEAEAARFVQRFLNGVQHERREVFILALLEQMSIPDVAAALSIPVNTAYTRLRLVRADFQKALDAEGRS